MKEELVVDGQKYIREDLCQQDSVMVPDNIKFALIGEDLGIVRNGRTLHEMNNNFDVSDFMRVSESGFKLVKVDKPRAGRVYVVNDTPIGSDDYDCLDDMDMYKLYLDDDKYCYWSDSGGIRVSELDWNDYYEVRIK